MSVNNNNNNNNNNNKKEVVEKRLYKVLGVTHDALPKDIKEAFYRKSRENHPDKGGNHELMREINQAYSILGNKSRRFVYDNEPGSLEDLDRIDRLAKLHPITSFFEAYYPLLAHSIVDRFFSFKAHIIAAALGLPRNAPNIHLNFSYIAAFPFFHLLADTTIDKLLTSSTSSSSNKSGSSKDNIVISKLKELSIFQKSLLIEVLSCLVAAPFELYAYRAFRSKYDSNRMFDYFTLGTANHLSPIKRIFHNTALYLRCFASSDIRYILGLAIFRIGYTLTSYFIMSIADYCDHKALTASMEAKEANSNNKKKNSKNSDNVEEYEEDDDSDYDESDDEEDEDDDNNSNIDTTSTVKEKLWKTASYGTTFLSYFIPSTIFSVYRLFYKIESPQISYFSYALPKSALLDSVSSYFIDFFNSSLNYNQDRSKYL